MGALFSLPADVGVPLDEVAGAPGVLPGQVNNAACVFGVRTATRWVSEPRVSMSTCALAYAVLRALGR